METSQIKIKKMNKCLYCNQIIPQIEGKKARLFCNEAHKKAYYRNRDKIEAIKSGQLIKSKSGQQVKYDPNIHKRQLTENEQLGLTEYGKCHGCGKVVSELICICQECFKKGMTHKSLNLNIAKCDY